MNLFSKFNTILKKSSATGPLVAWSQVGRAKWTPRRYENLAEEGYRKNVIAYRCASMIANAVATVPFLYYDENGMERPDSAQAQLLARPNPMQDRVAFMESIVSSLMLSGNAYIEAVESTAQGPRELYVLRADRMKIVPGTTGLPMAYDYSVNGRTIRWDVDQITGHAPILHIKLYHPLDDWYGMAPLEAALLSIDQHNAAGSWNQALLNQSARPSGALVFAPKEGPASLSEDQLQRLRGELEQFYQSRTNAGRPLVLEGGLEWREMSLSPQDMDWLAGREIAARDIALAFGVPSQLIGLPDSQTYANMAEARLAFYEETVLPLLHRILGAFNHWLAPMTVNDIRIEFDPDEISALTPRREALWQKINTATFLTEEEKREALGY